MLFKCKWLASKAGCCSYMCNTKGGFWRYGWITGAFWPDGSAHLFPLPSLPKCAIKCTNHVADSSYKHSSQPWTLQSIQGLYLCISWNHMHCFYPYYLFKSYVLCDEYWQRLLYFSLLYPTTADTSIIKLIFSIITYSQDILLGVTVQTKNSTEGTQGPLPFKYR